MRALYIDVYIKWKSEMRSFKSNDNIHKKEGGSYYVVSANKASSVIIYFWFLRILSLVSKDKNKI